MKTIQVNALTQRIIRHTKEEIETGCIGAKEVIVHQNGYPVFRGVFGHSSLGGEALKENQLFRAASMTKPITVAAVLTLVDRGLISLEDPISIYYPQAASLSVAQIENHRLVGTVPAKNPVRIYHLLSHTSGIGCSPLGDILDQSLPKMTLDKAVEKILTQPLSFEPGSEQSYSTTNAFDIAAGIVEQVSGLDFAEYLTRYLFRPLDMPNTTFSPTEAQWKTMVTMHDRAPDGTGLNAVMPTDCVFENYLPERTAAGAGLATTAGDYIRFADMLCRGGKAETGEPIFSPDTAKLMAKIFVPHAVLNAHEAWGLGVRVIVSKDYPGGLDVGCYGWSGAYGSHFWVDPTHHITAVMMKNSRYDGGAGNHSACQFERDVSDSLAPEK